MSWVQAAHDVGNPVTASSAEGYAVEASGAIVHSSPALAWRRCGDLFITSLSLLVVAVPMILIAVLVKVSSRGPALFTQDRIGRDGAYFKVLKFRTMTDGTHANVLASEAEHRRYVENDFKLDPDDQRITTLGRFLRKTSLDELPQLINVLRGDMSLVGIRPLVPLELEMRPDRDQMLYRSMRPGLTGLWQVEGRSSVGKVERLELDRRYVETWSPWQDVKLLLRTPLALLRIHHSK